MAARRFDIKPSLPARRHQVNRIAESDGAVAGTRGRVAYRGAIVSNFTRRGSVGLAMSVLLLFAATGCGGDGDSDSSDAAESEATVPEPVLNAAVIIDPGEGEAAQLRWEPSVGDRAGFEVVIGLDTVVELEGLAQEAAIGPAAVTYDATVSAVGPSGDITTDYEIINGGVPDGADPALDEVMQRLVGTTITQTVTSTGLPTSVDMLPPEPLGAAEQAQLDRFVRQLAAVFSPLPTEPVAEGASWTYATLVVIQGVTWTRTITYQLTALSDPTVELAVDIDEIAQFQEVDAAGPTNLEGTVEGSGRSEADLTALAPRDFESKTELDASIFTGDEKTGRTTNRTETTMRSVDSGP